MTLVEQKKKRKPHKKQRVHCNVHCGISQGQHSQYNNLSFSFFLWLSLNLFMSSLNDICSSVIAEISWSESIAVTLPRPETVSEAQKAQQMDNMVLLFMAENTWLSTNRPQSVVTLAALISVTERESRDYAPAVITLGSLIGRSALKHINTITLMTNSSLSNAATTASTAEIYSIYFTNHETN